MHLPEGMRRAFRIRVRGVDIAVMRLLFGWKFNPVLCQRVLGFFLGGLRKGGVVVFHYLDDFMFFGRSKREVR